MSTPDRRDLRRQFVGRVFSDPAVGGGSKRTRPTAFVRALIVTFLALAALSAAQSRLTFVGTITDDMCARGGHRQMRMGPTDADCTVACVMAHDAKYVLYDGKEVYILSDQQTPEKFAGKKVRVAGTLDAKTRTIKVESITAAE